MSPYAPFIRERNSDPTHSGVIWRISISFYSPGQTLCPVLIAPAPTPASPLSLTERFGSITPPSPTSMTSKSSCTDWPAYCEGVGLWASYSNNNNDRPWEGKGDFAIHASLYGKVQAEPTSTSDGQERRGKKWRPLCVARAGLSSYLYRLCITCVNLSMLEVVSTPLRYSFVRWVGILKLHNQGETVWFVYLESPGCGGAG
jgi:hypothetical protein